MTRVISRRIFTNALRFLIFGFLEPKDRDSRANKGDFNNDFEEFYCLDFRSAFKAQFNSVNMAIFQGQIVLGDHLA
ncbi:Uncharacterised protein [uncultured archaeon]|nr:Uncharacterised protein [uncultured archaeon]